MGLATNLKIRKQFPERFSWSLWALQVKGVAGKGQAVTWVGDSSELLWASEWQTPNEQVGLLMRQHLPASLLVGAQQAKQPGSSPPPCLGFGLGLSAQWQTTFPVQTGSAECCYKAKWEHFILPFETVSYSFKRFDVWPPQALHVYITSWAYPY